MAPQRSIDFNSTWEQLKFLGLLFDGSGFVGFHSQNQNKNQWTLNFLWSVKVGHCVFMSLQLQESKMAARKWQRVGFLFSRQKGHGCCVQLYETVSGFHLKYCRLNEARDSLKMLKILLLEIQNGPKCFRNIFSTNIKRRCDGLRKSDSALKGCT